MRVLIMKLEDEKQENKFYPFTDFIALLFRVIF
jgi:hypothetical protein